ncbi:hypothetical protein KIN20_023165 [Parelaphostrongylus tenuis]|uniref:Phlebovirus glycoprotein G2 fusion domain-containing protein n=1 Tax=Parelaphostrongylus tenuis TaxID=148309 RepID=A0AAD5MRB3_PARTN|nr:hypothetical protein KIN20_023165 [Parelaphostrongylus tenuis]
MHTLPPLQCNNRTTARNLQCKVVEECTCYPAEVRANCRCNEPHISSFFRNARHRLPIIMPPATFQQTKTGRKQAIIPRMTTAEIILSIQDELKTEVVVDSVTCHIGNTSIQGYYECAKGAMAHMTCTSETPAQAEIVCPSATFTVPCEREGKHSKLYFSFSQARAQEKCTVTCGIIITRFEVGGIFKFTDTAAKMFSKWLHGDTKIEMEIQWPDLWHIVDILLQWYKTVAIALLGLLIIMALTYAFGGRIIAFAYRWVARLIIAPFWLLYHVLNGCRKQLTHDKGLKYL